MITKMVHSISNIMSLQHYSYKKITWTLPVGAIGRFWGKLGYLLMYVPWLIIAICNIILDVISVIVFTRDAGNTNVSKYILLNYQLLLFYIL